MGPAAVGAIATAADAAQRVAKASATARQALAHPSAALMVLLARMAAAHVVAQVAARVATAAAHHGAILCPAPPPWSAVTAVTVPNANPVKARTFTPRTVQSIGLCVPSKPRLARCASLTRCAPVLTSWVRVPVAQAEVAVTLVVLEAAVAVAVATVAATAAVVVATVAD